MPYKNIHWIKLEKRLLEDPRWYMMCEQSQLNYVKFLLLSAYNSHLIPKNLKAIKLALKTNQRLSTIKKTIQEIKQNFPKFKETNDFYYFEGFEERTNPTYFGKSQGNPREFLGSVQNKKKKKNKNKIKIKEEDKEEKNPTAAALLKILNLPSTDQKWAEDIISRYPFRHYLEEAKDMLTWWEEGRKKLKRPKSAYKNWIMRAKPDPLLMERKKTDKTSAEFRRQYEEWSKQEKVDPEKVEEFLNNLSKIGGVK